MRESYHKVNDYVMYNGDYTTLNETRRFESLAKIINYDENRFPLIGLELLNGEKITVGNSLISMILTKKEHLNKLGFIEENKCFRLNDIKISSFSLELINQSNKTSYIFISGFRFMGLDTNFQNLPRFIEDNEINLEKLELSYPDLNNLNDLINLLKKNNIEIPIEEICKL
jgi:hypothetical protein